MSLLAVAPSINAETPHGVKGTIYIDGAIAGAGIEIEIEFYEDSTYVGSETGTTFAYDGYYNFNIGFNGHEGETGYFRIQDQLPDDIPEPYVEITESIDYYYIDSLNFSGFDDIEPPSKVTGLSVIDAKDGKLDLSWDAASDNVAVDHYNIYRDDLFLTATAGTSYQDTGLDDGQEYCYKVSAVDTSDNEGEKSDQECATPTESITPNNPPNKPTSPIPANNSKDIIFSPLLDVYVTDPDGDTMSVSFYNASDDSIIATDPAVNNATRAEVVWWNLEFNTTYYWYAVSYDGEFYTKSDIFNFKTIEKLTPGDNNSPTVSFEKPAKNGLYIFNNTIFTSIPKIPFIIGQIGIIVNATDNESGIARVELSIKGMISETTENLTEYPYTYEWSRLSLGKYNITATAYDMSGNSANTSIIVRKFL